MQTPEITIVAPAQIIECFESAPLGERLFAEMLLEPCLGAFPLERFLC